jgi:hypothetical protein
LLDRCCDDLVVILAATEPDIAALIESVGLAASFEMLRGLLRQGKGNSGRSGAWDSRLSAFCG